MTAVFMGTGMSQDQTVGFSEGGGVETDTNAYTTVTEKTAWTQNARCDEQGLRQRWSLEESDTKTSSEAQKVHCCPPRPFTQRQKV